MLVTSRQTLKTRSQMSSYFQYLNMYMGAVDFGCRFSLTVSRYFPHTPSGSSISDMNRWPPTRQSGRYAITQGVNLCERIASIMQLPI